MASFIGIDRTDLGSVLFWREDFATLRLGYLLNGLAVRADSVLVSRDFLEEQSLEIGEFLQIEIRSIGERIPLSFQIVGTIDYFPRWYPEDDGVLFVSNLDYLFQQAQIELPHRIIARINKSYDEREFKRDLMQRGAVNVLVEEPVSRITQEQFRPERQGLFGLLSIGFIASTLATVLGFLLYTLFSYQRRYIELGILRAIGLSQSSMILAVAWELCLLTVVGVTAGIFDRTSRQFGIYTLYAIC